MELDLQGSLRVRVSREKMLVVHGPGVVWGGELAECHHCHNACRRERCDE